MFNILYVILYNIYMVVKGNNIFLPQKGYQTKPNGKLVLHWSKNSSQALPTPAGSHVTYCMPYTVLHLDEHSMSLDLNHMAQHSPRHLFIQDWS